MRIHWHDSEERLHPGRWRGLRLTVCDTNRPRLVVGACRPRAVPGAHAPRCIRISSGLVPLLWARISNDHYWYELLRPRRRDSPNVLPPIPFRLVEEQSRASRDGSTLPAWARLYAEWLAGSPASPLSNGLWQLGCFGPNLAEDALPLAVVRSIVAQRRSASIEWDFGENPYAITLRDVSASDSGRVKAWRKHARARTLPPILLYPVTGLDAYVVLDGHDRLMAASLEEIAAPALSLERIREIAPDTSIQKGVSHQVSNAPSLSVETANKILLDAFVPKASVTPTCAYPIAGGFDSWREEVRLELDAQGIRQSMLVDDPH